MRQLFWGLRVRYGLIGVCSKRRIQRVRALFSVLAAVIFVGLIGWLKQDYLREQVRQFWTIGPYVKRQVAPYVLTAAAERALKPGDSFKECAKDCPEMVVVPAGEFTMRSPTSERGGSELERAQRTVAIAKQFAVSKFPLTFGEWDTCAAYGDCPQGIISPFGRGRMPVVNVTSDDAQTYVKWFSRITGKAYRLLSEAEYDYAALAGTRTAYPWGDDITRKGADRQLHRLQQQMGPDADCSGRLIPPEPFWPLRHGRQCAGLDRGLLES